MPLDCFEFGRQLLETKDLDPVYVCVWEAGLEEHLLKKWLLAYWCFYDMGTASVISSAPSYWSMMKKAAGTKDFPRGSERRHFRGNNSLNSVAYLSSYGVDQLFAPLLRQTSCEGVMKEVTAWTGFGPWIAFKVADMLEALGLAEISFDAKSVFLFDSPREGAETLREELEGDAKTFPTAKINSWAVETILKKLSKDYPLAPPDYRRPLGAQEAETILCKWKSHFNGRYKIGEDIAHGKKSLKRLDCSLSRRLYAGGKKGGLW